MQEKTAREMQEKSTWAGMEEKFMSVISKIDQERYAREEECDTLRKRIKGHEDTQISANMAASDQQNRVQEIANNMEQVYFTVQQMQASVTQLKRDADDSNAQIKQLCHSQFNELRQMLHNEQLQRERANEQGSSTVQNQIKLLTEALAKESLSREQATKLATTPLWENIDKLTRAIEMEKLSRTDLLSKMQQAQIDQHTQTRDDIKKQVQKIEQNMLKSDKTHSDKHFALNMTMERDIEERNKMLLQLNDALAAIENKRQNSEKEILKLIASTMSRLKSGMETDLHPSLL